MASIQKEKKKGLSDFSTRTSLGVWKKRENETITRCPNRGDWELTTKICTAQRPTWVMNSLQPFKSPGTNAIFPALPQEGA